MQEGGGKREGESGRTERFRITWTWRGNDGEREREDSGRERGGEVSFGFFLLFLFFVSFLFPSFSVLLRGGGGMRSCMPQAINISYLLALRGQVLFTIHSFLAIIESQTRAHEGEEHDTGNVNWPDHQSHVQ